MKNFETMGQLILACSERLFRLDTKLEDAGRCWRMLEVWSAKKQNRETHCAFPQELGCFPPVTTWTGVNFGKFAKPAKAAKNPIPKYPTWITGWWFQPS